MDLRKCLLTKNNCYKAGKKITVKGIMWHSTGANNPNLKRYVQPDDGKLGDNPNNNDWNRALPDGREVCVHAFIGKDKNGKVCTYQTLPWNYRGWHCGGSGNDKYIGFEICEDDLKNKDYFNAVYKEAVELTAFLCKENGLNPKGENVIICHQDGHKLGIASNHSDVYHWFNKFDKDMDDVRNDVAKAMGQTSSSSTASKPSTSTSSSSYYKAFNSTSIVDGLKSIGVDSSMANRKKIAAANGISNYSGDYDDNVKLLELAKKGKLKKPGSFTSTTTKPTTSSTQYYKKFKSTSIVDGLKSIGVDSSMSNRKKIAKANGISNYDGDYSDNVYLLELASQGKLKKA